jgi:myo-inositol 2-dehydrogenase / D-chiro-inositol 1-dehydrogenase
VDVRVGVIGVGVMGADHARHLHHVVSGARVSAIADYNHDIAATVAQSLLGAAVLHDGVTLIHDEQVDAIVIASHDTTHAELALAAVAAGKPILCEKPLALTAADAAAVVQAERHAGQHLIGLGFMRRFDPSYVELKAIADAGELGDILVAHCVSRTVTAGPGGDSANTITNAAIHELDIMPWLLGSPIAEVSWHAGRTSRHSGIRQDPQILLLRAASDVLITVEVFLNARYGYDTRCEIVGEHGAASLTHPTRVTIDRDRTKGVWYPENWIPRYADAYRLELQEWIDAITAGRSSRLATAADGLQAALVADALVASTNDGGAPVAVAAPVAAQPREWSNTAASAAATCTATVRASTPGWSSATNSPARSPNSETGCPASP